MKKKLSAIVLLWVLFLAGCGNQDHTNIFHATFTADSVSKDFTTNLGFLNLNGYDISYLGDPSGVDSNKNYLQIGLPSGVKTGDTFTQQSDNCLLLYKDANGKWYRGQKGSAYDSTFTITVTSWPGPGGYAHGTFTGMLKDEDTNSVTVSVQNGAFEGFIHN